jgi:aquaporin Z
MQKYVAEFVGTLVFLTIILKSGSFGVVQPFMIVAGLLAAILFMGDVSGGHFNPAVSVMKFLSKDISGQTLFFYIVAQVLGGAAALQVAGMKA